MNDAEDGTVLILVKGAADLREANDHSFGVSVIVLSVPQCGEVYHNHAIGYVVYVLEDVARDILLPPV